MRRQLPDLPPVNTFEVAPHRYLWNEPFKEESLNWTHKDVVANAPYKKGEVVYVICGDSFAKAIITFVRSSRDYYGDLREEYYVRRETKQGTWAKREYTVFPGYIQRGYYRAGLAPDIPKGAL